VQAGVDDRVVEIREQVAVAGEPVEGADRAQDALVLGAGSLEKHGDRLDPRDQGPEE
jgi:hypothetical protein